MSNPHGQVLVIGGSGFYGQYLVADLLAHTSARITITSRNPRWTSADRDRVSLVACNLNELPELTRLAHACDVMVHCAGPFQYLPLNPLLAGIAAKCDYIDLAQDRQFALPRPGNGQSRSSADTLRRGHGGLQSRNRTFLAQPKRFTLRRCSVPAPDFHPGSV
jgi:saccharopine dehydrogenase-like NADP-dependent oxidoreductase